jgi:hypothetical protein
MTQTQNVFILKLYQSFTPTCQRVFLQQCPKEFIIFLCECIINLLAGKLKVVKSSLEKYKRQLRRLSQKRPSVKERRLILSSAKGIGLVKTFAPSVIDRFSCE